MDDRTFARLTDGHPELRRRAVDSFVDELASHPDDTARVTSIWRQIGRLIELPESPSVCVLGCGPRPQVIRLLRDWGATVVGIEPIPGFVELGRQFIGDPDALILGAAESIDLAADSQDVVFFENVLEHVESPRDSIAEIYRILKPGGVAYIVTTNRYRWSWTGRNGEYRVRFFNWFPPILQESYVFTHLHYRPNLANYSLRPAVHWFTYGALCQLGRESGFAQFYSPIDLREKSDYVNRGLLKSVLLGRSPLLSWLQRVPFLRTLLLTQMGAEIYMWKRPM